jgi:hypothetical protein
MALDRVASLEQRFWPRGERRDVWMIVDAARSSRIYPLLLECHLEYKCLYSGAIAPEVKLAAPYLIQLEHQDRDTRRFLTSGWGNSWGIILKCDTNIERLRRHLRTLLQVRNPKGKRLLFRYYDPRVLRLYLPSCLLTELRRVFGPVERFWTEDETEQTLLEFGFNGAKLLSRALPLSSPVVDEHKSLIRDGKREAGWTAPEPHRQMLTIRNDQLSMFFEAEVRKFETWMAAHLAKFFPGQCAALGEHKLLATIQYGIKRAARHGLTAKRDVCKYIDVMIVLGRDFDTHKRYPWAGKLLKKRDRADKKARALIEAAKLQVRR